MNVYVTLTDVDGLNIEVEDDEGFEYELLTASYDVHTDDDTGRRVKCIRLTLLEPAQDDDQDEGDGGDD